MTRARRPPPRRAVPPERSSAARLWASLGAARRLELFLEMFNVPNFVDLTGGNNNMNVTAFLVRTGARDPRQLQWGARYTF